MEVGGTVQCNVSDTFRLDLHIPYSLVKSECGFPVITVSSAKHVVLGDCYLSVWFCRAGDNVISRTCGVLGHLFITVLFKTCFERRNLNGFAVFIVHGVRGCRCRVSFK